ncbi:MAG: transporter associated domain-containing protein, partial [Acidobacteriota bacterium]
RNKNIVVRDDGSMLIDGETSVADFRELLELDSLPKGEHESYQTLAGFIIARLEKLPSEGEKIEWEGYVFEVVDMDGRRVDKVLVRREDPSV